MKLTFGSSNYFSDRRVNIANSFDVETFSGKDDDKHKFKNLTIKRSFFQSKKKYNVDLLLSYQRKSNIMGQVKNIELLFLNIFKQESQSFHTDIIQIALLNFSVNILTTYTTLRAKKK